MSSPLATHDYATGGLAATLAFLKRTRGELRTLRWVRAWFEVRGLGYKDADVIPLLQNLNTAFNPETIHNDIDAEYKEYGTGNRYPWAYDRVM